MAKAPSPSTDPNAPPSWEPPTSDQEFVFESLDSAPSWVDKNWATFDRGPALAVPMGAMDGIAAYHTAPARPGDTVKYVAAKGASPGHFVIVPGVPDPSKPGQVTKAVPQQSAASLEDLLRGGLLTPDDLSDTDKAAVIASHPGLRGLIEEGKGAPEPQSIANTIKTS
jgi:hypothetical protein